MNIILNNMREIFFAACLVLSALPGAGNAASQAAWSRIPVAKYWIKRYPLRQYGAHWGLTIQLKDFGEGRKKALKILEKNEGKSDIPLSRMASSEKWGFQQLSFELEREKAERALDELKKLGSVERLIQNENLVPELTEDIFSKLGRLKTEREAGKATIDRFGAIAAVIDELIEHLEIVDQAFMNSANKILINITLKKEEE